MKILEEFLAAGFVGVDIAFFENVGFEIFEADGAFLDFGADAGVPGAVTVFDEFDRGGCLCGWRRRF